MADTVSRSRATRRWASVAFWVEVGLWLRVAAALAVEWVARRRGDRCLFPDTEIYWELARAIRAGGPYEISSWGVPHFSVRTPGYPLFLAACQTLFGESPLSARLVQAVLGAACVWLAARLVERVTNETQVADGGWNVPVLTSALVAIEPYTILNSAFLLSEAVFLPFLLLALWGLAALWRVDDARRAAGWQPGLIALGTGLATGFAVLTKPSWALFTPAAWLVWVCVSPAQRTAAVRAGLLLALGMSVAMAPWWIRNARVYGRFVPTALWAGASLYDGLNPRATGASDMEFLNTPEMQPMSEEAQDRVLLERARSFVRTHPRRTLELALIKAGRFWSPWPNADGMRSPVRYLGAAFSLPIYGIMIAGLWRCRRKPRALTLLAGPLFYFAVMHMIFVGALRYRVPAAVPALGLAAIGLAPWIRGATAPTGRAGGTA